MLNLSYKIEVIGPALIAFILAFVVGLPWESSYASDETGQTIRPPAAAGRFYPDDPEELRKMVGTLLRDASGLAPGRRPAVKTCFQTPKTAHLWICH